MSNAFTSSMFDSIKESLTKETETQSQFKDILRLKVGNTYTVRLLPNISDSKQTFLHYYGFGWNSLSTGKYFSVVSPTTWENRCPIAEERLRIYRTGSVEEKEKGKLLRRSEHWLVNVYVINDPVTPENNGKIKVLRFGKQLHKIIMDAIDGEEADEYGARIFDLTGNGVDFKIKVEEQGTGNEKWATYVSSKFSSPKEVKGLSSGDIEKIYESLIDLKLLAPVKSYDELRTILDEHYFCTKPVSDEADVVVAENTPINSKTVSKSEPVTVDVNDPEIENLLKDL